MVERVQRQYRALRHASPDPSRVESPALPTLRRTTILTDFVSELLSMPWMSTPKRVYRMILTFWACIVTLYSSDTSSDSLAGLYVRTYVQLESGSVSQPVYRARGSPSRYSYSYGDIFATNLIVIQLQCLPSLDFYFIFLFYISILHSPHC